MKVLTKILLALLLILIGCSSTSIKDFSGTELDYQFTLPDSGDFYFPINTDPNSRNVAGLLDSFSNIWYSEHLYSLREPILYSLTKNIEIYRYTNLGSWERPFSFRIVKTDSTITITKKLTDGHGGYDSGKLIIDQTKRISLLEWNKFSQIMNEYEFWGIPSNIDNFGLDGARWILEGYKDGEYHFIDRWSPDNSEASNFVTVCNSLEELFEEINNETDTE